MVTLTLRRRLLASLLLVGGCVAGLLTVGATPSAFGSYVAGVTNSTNTAATNPYWTCAAAAKGEAATKATFAYPLSESGGTSATDGTGNGNTGLYSSSGIGYGVANGGLCPRDNLSVVTLDGAAGYVSGPTAAVTGPNVFSEEIWFRTTSAQGKLIGFGNNRTTVSGNYDRHLYIDSAGKLEFGVYPGAVKTIASSATVTDGVWHYAAGTLSTAGMALYLDGKLVASNTAVTTAQAYSGYWRIGYDNLSGWTSPPATYYFKGNLAWPAVYSYALTATQVAQHYAAGTGS